MPEAALSEEDGHTGIEGGAAACLLREIGAPSLPAELRLYLRLSELVASSDQLELALSRVLGLLLQSYAFPRAEAWLASADGAALERVQSVPAEAERVGPDSLLSGQGFLAPLGTGESDPAWLERGHDERALALPIRAGAETVGALVFDVGRETAVKRETVALLSVVARQLGPAVLRRRAEDARREGVEKLRLLLENVSDAVVLLDPEGRVVTWTRAAARIFGRSAEQAVGRTLVEALFADERAQRDALASAVASGSVEGELALGAGSDREIWAAYNLRPIRVDGALTGFATIVADRSEARRAALEVDAKTRDLLRSNQDLEAFASIASHDLQEPLRKIRAFGDRLKRRYGSELPDEAQDFLRRMTSAAERMQHLIDDVLMYSRIRALGASPPDVDLNLVLAEVIGDMQTALAERRASILCEGLPTVQADATQMRQLFQNLLANALKFAHTERPPRIVVRARPLADDRYEIELEDNGIGFEAKYGERIFGLLQRLHGRSEYDGTGMGLAICRRIVDRHRGSIRAHGRPGEGATFTFVLPRRTRSLTIPPLALEGRAP